MKKSNKNEVFFCGVILAVTLGIAFLVATNFNTLRDLALGVSYNPSEEVAKMSETLNLTYPGQIIYRAAHPVIEDGDDFLAHCVDEANAPVLGCYNAGVIYVHNIDVPELAGIIESTTMHEYLHAIWQRLDADEKHHLEDTINEFYDAHHEELRIVDDYPEDSKFDELFARIGSEFREIPSSLEEVYARYFIDRQSLVEYYESYQSTFREIATRLESLSAQISTLKVEIEAKSAKYNEQTAALNTKIAEFNDCAARADCFDSYSFNTQRSELTAWQNSVNDQRVYINDSINRYNSNIEEYNENVLKNNYFNEKIDNIERNDQ